MNDQILGYCGLYCGGCIVLQKTARGEKAVVDGKEVTCDGCAGDDVSPWCSDCAIKNCNRTKGYRYCLECGEYPCGMMTGFMNDPKYPYHLEVTDNMKRLKEIGFERWGVEMDESYTCASCGKKNNWFENACPECGAALKNGRSSR